MHDCQCGHRQRVGTRKSASIQRFLKLVGAQLLRVQGLARIEIFGVQTSESVVHWFLEILFASEVAFGGQNRGVAKKELNLLKLASIDMTQLRAGSPQIVGRKVVKFHFSGTVPNHIPDHVLRNSLTPTRFRAD
jgi:hypothetical protein